MINELQISGLMLKVQTSVPNRLVLRRYGIAQFELKSSTP